MADDLVKRLRREGWSPTAWSNGPGARYAAHEHDFDKILVVSAGTIRFSMADGGEVVSIGVGDRLDLLAGTAHDAVVGPDGVTCLEAHAPSGTLAAVVRHDAGTW